MEEECSVSSESSKTTSQDSEIRDQLNKTSWENTGRESSLYRWSSFTETSIQFAESDSSGTPSSDDSSSVQGEESKGKDASRLSTATTESSYGDEQHEGYSQDEFELLEESDKTEDSGGELKEEFLDKKIQILNSKINISTPANVEKSDLTLVEAEVQMEYYQQKIYLLDKKQICGKEKHNQGVKLPKNIKDEPNQLENARRNVERLKVNNTLFKIKKENAVPVHQPQKCKKCKKLQGRLAEESYIRKKTEILRKQEVEKKIEKHLYEKDSATLIAEIIKSGPKPSDPPQEIWDRLLRRGDYS